MTFVILAMIWVGLGGLGLGLSQSEIAEKDAVKLLLGAMLLGPLVFGLGLGDFIRKRWQR